MGTVQGEADVAAVGRLLADERTPAPRVVHVTDLGRSCLREHLGLDWSVGRAGAA